MNKYFILTLALIFKINLAYSDILFVDLNINNKEVAAARKAATERGEKLVVYPELSSEVRSEIEKLKSVKKKASDEEKDLFKVYNKKEDTLYGNLNKLTTAFRSERDVEKR